jgi:electron transport complex protein RnfB
VDCISLENVSGERTGRDAWSQAQANEALERYESRGRRLTREAAEHEERLEAKAQNKLSRLPELTHHADSAELDRKRAVIEAALARARARR